MASSSSGRRGARVLLALLVVLAVAPSAAAVATAQADVTERSADLVVRQESYVDRGVSVQSQDGRPVYVVRGEQVWLRPANFNVANVVEFGVTTGAGQLAYDAEMDAYTFDPEGEQATFDVYWIVREQVAVNRTVEENGTNVTRTVTEARQVRYVATIKVAGGVGLVHQPRAELEQIRADARKWHDWNATLDQILRKDLFFWFGEKPDKQQLMQAMVSTYVTTRDPLLLLTGGLTAIVILLGTTAGGWLLLGADRLRETVVLWKLRKQVNRYIDVEEDEAEVSERLQRHDRQLSERAFAKQDYQDIPVFSDRDAAAWREAFGPTPRVGYENLLATIHETVWVRDHLIAMGQSGWAARIDERDADGDDRVVAATLVRVADVIDATEGAAADIETSEDLSESDEYDALADPSDDLVRALLDDEALWEFDVREADVDLDDLDTEPLTLTLDELLADLPLDPARVGGPERAGELLHAHIEAVAASPYTDEDGRPRPARRALASMLDAAEWMGDVADIPSATVVARNVEAALVHHDPTRETRQLVEDVRTGRGTD